MKEDLHTIPVVFIGAGNLAVNLAKAMHRKGFHILQVYSRTPESASALASTVQAGYTTSLSEITPEGQLYIVSLQDEAFLHLLPEIVRGKDNALIVHTAGSIPMSVWQGRTPRYGVLYPMQTFSKHREVSFDEIPFFIESNSESDTCMLKAIASLLSNHVYEASSEQRKSLHLAAVFACNFTNHMYTLSAKLLAKYNLPFSTMLSLIDETARKVHEISPQRAQTGPAVRNDISVMKEHLSMLNGEPEMQQLYELLSDSIKRESL